MAGKRSKLGFPPQPCGLSYKDFRAGWKYRDAYEMVAYGRGEGPRTITPRTVQRELRKLKQAEYERYLESCAYGTQKKRSSDCDKICRVKSNPCGRGCVSKKLVCRKPAAERVCSIDDFQVSFDFKAEPVDSSDFLDGLGRRKRR